MNADKREQKAMRKRHWIRQRGSAAVLLLAAATAFSSRAGAQGSSPAPAAPNTLTVGALLSLTGTWSTLGLDSQAALQIAAQDLNAQLARQGVATRVQVMVADTQLDPNTALQELQMLAKSGIRIVIGPQSSAEVKALKPYADQNGIVLISQGSTASSLSIPGDNIFRFVPDDTQEAVAMAALLRADGIRTIVPVWRADTGNQNLTASVRQAVQAGGGTVTDGVQYAANNQSPASQDFTAELPAIKSQINQAVAASNAGAVGVYLAAFDEGAALFAQASADPIFSAVRWYGSDGTALSQAFTSNPAATAFAARVGYPCPTYGLDDALAARWKPVADQILARTGIPPDALALSAYDALGVATLAAVQAGGTTDIEAFKKAFVQVAANYAGITGSVALNAAGDRQSGTYDFWALCHPAMSTAPTANGMPQDLFAWTRVAVYQPLPDGTGTISRLPGCR
jgi:branched-chain amino acid transport system substrate-binding protein